MFFGVGAASKAKWRLEWRDNRCRCLALGGLVCSTVLYGGYSYGAAIYKAVHPEEVTVFQTHTSCVHQPTSPCMPTL